MRRVCSGEANISFACPGHQGGEFYRKSPAGQLFFKHFGEQIFRNDLCNADVDLGDLLIHVGAAVEAQRHAAVGSHRIADVCGLDEGRKARGRGTHQGVDGGSADEL